jgi:hypothetical protein
MPGKKRPTDQDAATARLALLDGLAPDADIFEVLSELAPLHPRNDTFPGEVFLHLAADALEWCGGSRAEPLPLEELRERYLPECAFRGRQNAKLEYAVLAAAAVHGGTEPDLLEEVAYWQTDDFWQYAMYVAVAYTSASTPASRLYNAESARRTIAFRLPSSACRTSITARLRLGLYRRGRVSPCSHSDS